MKKRFSIIILASAGVLMLTGCQGKDSSKYEKYVTLGEYKGLTIDRVVSTITDEDVQQEIQSELYYNAEYTEVTDRPCQEGDTVNIDYDGTIDGKSFDGGSDSGFDLELGSGTFLPEFESSINGMKAGETKEFEVTFPEDYDGVVDGQTAVFSVTVNSITEIVLPEYNDAYVQANTDYSTTSEYEAAMKTDLQSYYDENSDYMAWTDALAEVVSSSTFDGYPEEMYDTAKTQMEEENAAFAEEMGMDVSELFGEDYDIDTEVQDLIHEQLVVLSIAEKEKLTVSDEEYQEYVDSNWELYGYETSEDFIDDYGEDSIRYQVIYDKVLHFLSENNTFEDISEEEYYGDFEEEDDGIDFDISEDEMEDAEDADSEAEDETDTAEETFSSENGETNAAEE